MTTADDVAPLAERLARVTGDPDAIRGLAAKWRDATGRCDTYTDTISTAANRVGTEWHGDSADAFVAYVGRFAQAGDAVGRTLADCANALDSAAKALEDAHGTVLAAYETAVTQVDAYRRRNQRHTEDQLQPHIREIVSAQLGVADRSTEAANEALSTAATALRAAVTKMTPRFTDLRPPGDQEFTPVHGHNWIPTPLPAAGTPRTVLAAGGFGGYGPSGPPPGGNIPAPRAEVEQWIRQALGILKDAGVPVDPDNPEDVENAWTIIYHESGGNPNAINLWDSNAANGTPSKGLMQTIDTTFNAHALPGHGDIYNPVDNIIAGVRYAIGRYGSLDALVAPHRASWSGY